MTLPWRDFPASAGRLEVDEQIAGRLDRWSRATPLSLFFDGDTERAFARDRSRRFYPVARFALALAVLFYLAFLAVDALSFEYYDDPWMRLLSAIDKLAVKRAKALAKGTSGRSVIPVGGANPQAKLMHIRHRHTDRARYDRRLTSR